MKKILALCAAVYLLTNLPAKAATTDLTVNKASVITEEKKPVKKKKRKVVGNANIPKPVTTLTPDPTAPEFQPQE